MPPFAKISGYMPTTKHMFLPLLRKHCDYITTKLTFTSLQHFGPKKQINFKKVFFFSNWKILSDRRRISYNVLMTISDVCVNCVEERGLKARSKIPTSAHWMLIPECKNFVSTPENLHNALKWTVCRGVYTCTADGNLNEAVIVDLLYLTLQWL